MGPRRPSQSTILEGGLYVSQRHIVPFETVLESFLHRSDRNPFAACRLFATTRKHGNHDDTETGVHTRRTGATGKTGSGTLPFARRPYAGEAAGLEFYHRQTQPGQETAGQG